jgi:hypothetical protein
MHSTYEKSHFQAYLEELLAIPSSDILVHCSRENKQLVFLDTASTSPISFPLTPAWKRLVSFAASVHKSADTHTLCVAIDTVTFSNQQQTPIWLVPLRYRIIKSTNTLEISFELEDAFLNPYLLLEYKKIHEATLENADLETFEANKEFVYQVLKEHTYPITEVTIIGNFHHHRFLLVKELEELQTQVPSELVQSLLGNESATTKKHLFLDEGNLSALDSDQQAVIKSLENHNVVVEGPPGTGKSELITNILAKRLTSNTSQLLVSEKKTALDVIAKKLAKNGLDPYAIVLSSDTRTKDLIDQLSATWKLVENNFHKVRQPMYLGQQKRANLQLLLDKLTAKGLVGGIAYSAFLGMLAGKDLASVPYVSNVPSMKDWLQEVEKIADFYVQQPNVDTLKSFQKTCFEKNVRLDEVIDSYVKESTFLYDTFGVTTVSEVEELLSEVIYVQMIENEVVKKQFALFEKDSLRKKFKKLYFELQKKQKECALLHAEMTVWKIVPTPLQVRTWESNLTNGSWWTRRKLRIQIAKNLNDTNISIPEIIATTQKYLEVQAALTQLEIDCLRLGVQPITSELESIYGWVIQWESKERTKIKAATKRSVTYRRQLVENNQRIKQFLHNLHNYFTFNTHFSLIAYGEHLQKAYTGLLPFTTFFSQLTLTNYSLIQEANTFEALEKIVLKSHLVQLENLFPVLRTFSGEELGRKLDALIQVESIDNQEFVKYIHAKRAAKFHAYHTILQTPSTKLSAPEKGLKARLKKGKSILVKEFAKTRHTKSIRELLNSEAKEWMELLVPIWLCTPGQVATSFPMASSFFELVIIDEASQLPLTHALGALQRSARALVCGDSKQMAPGSYFSKKSEQIDILHHASYYWKSSTLTHHYRSQHPALIAFSNKHFYQNQLLAYPTAQQKTFPIQLHVCSDGVFTQRKNEVEAEKIARAIEKQVEIASDSIGVVAFSQEQLSCIWQHLSAVTKEKISENLETGNGFFKTLEQVQGEECAQLFISIGYGRNEAGKFQLRMGPLNRRNGYRRLNVLFTRAQKNIHLFTSVLASDFPITDNESMQLLRLYLQDAAQKHTESTWNFPFALTPTYLKDQHVKFDSIYDTLHQADELITFHQVMQNRGWIVNY